MPGYEVWTHHDESVRQTASVVEEDDRMGDDRMYEMLDTIRPKLETKHELLYEHTIVSVLAFATHLMSIKSKFTFSNNCYKELLNLISDVIPNNHKMSKDMYQ
jgi:hypothetical protein